MYARRSFSKAGTSRLEVIQQLFHLVDRSQRGRTSRDVRARRERPLRDVPRRGTVGGRAVRARWGLADVAGRAARWGPVVSQIVSSLTCGIQ